MTKEELINECLKLPDTYLDYPFDESTAVLKIKPSGKMFAYTDYVNPEKIKKNCGADAPVKDGDLFINLKCEPALCEIFRKQYRGVLPGYYANKLHWNTIIVGLDVPFEELQKMIRLSYDLVALKKK